MNNFRLYCAQCVVGVIGGGVSSLFLELLYGFLAFGNDHPINMALKFFGAKPLALNLPEILEPSVVGLAPLGISIATAICIHVSLTLLTIQTTYKSILALDDRFLSKD